MITAEFGLLYTIAIIHSTINNTNRSRRVNVTYILGNPYQMIVNVQPPVCPIVGIMIICCFLERPPSYALHTVGDCDTCQVTTP